MRPPSDTRPGSADDSDQDAVGVEIGPLTAEALTATNRPGEGLSSALERALDFYFGDGRERVGWAYPEFLGIDGGDAGVEVAVPRDLWRRLAAEAAQQQVEPAALARHAALFFAAARDGGTG